MVLACRSDLIFWIYAFPSVVVYWVWNMLDYQVLVLPIWTPTAHTSCPADEASAWRDNTLHDSLTRLLFSSTCSLLLWLDKSIVWRESGQKEKYIWSCIFNIIIKTMHSILTYWGRHLQVPTLLAASTRWSEWMPTGVHSSDTGIRKESESKEHVDI